MRWCTIHFPILTVLALTGCITGQSVQPAGLLDRIMQFRGPSGPDVVAMDVALLEAPVGDKFINEELWALADDQVVTSEQKAMLEDNGFRVALVGGITPAGLCERLTSERSCSDPRRIQLHAGRPAPVALGPPMASCSFELQVDGGTVPITLDQALCQLVVTPALAPDGRIRLRFTPQIQNGKPQELYGPAPDRSGWLYQHHQAVEKYPNLAWEVLLAPNEFVVIGARYDRPGTLGHRSLIRRDDPLPRQRLLVIRTARTGSPPPETATAPAPSAPALALQAAWPASRGASP
jgi:hypothetical protein